MATLGKTYAGAVNGLFRVDAVVVGDQDAVDPEPGAVDALQLEGIVACPVNVYVPGPDGHAPGSTGRPGEGWICLIARAGSGRSATKLPGGMRPGSAEEKSAVWSAA